MARTRKGGLRSLLTGILIAAIFTLGCMLALAAALLGTQLGDGTLRILNQIIKYLAILLGVRAAVPRGGEQGLATGAAVALAYVALGYAMYVLLGGGSFGVVSMLGEALLGVTVGAVTGAVRANLRPKRRRTA